MGFELRGWGGQGTDCLRVGSACRLWVMAVPGCMMKLQEAGYQQAAVSSCAQLHIVLA